MRVNNLKKIYYCKKYILSC